MIVRARLLLMLGIWLGAATPALALEDCGVPQQEDCEIRVSNWMAPLDDQPQRAVKFFSGLELAANEGVIDRALRLGGGGGLLFLAAADPMMWGSWPRVALGLGSAVLLGTSLVGVCPAYSLFSLSTRHAQVDVK
jgi:hypothetical protein